jgi:type IV pilus assembly protein PilE
MRGTILDRRPTAGNPATCAPTGFTLLDLLTALAIAGLLACIAVPSYRAQAIRAHRTDARAALLALAAAEENFHATCNAYAAILDEAHEPACGASSLQFPGMTGQGGYALELTSADATHWTAAATAIAGSPQARDDRCRVLRLTSTGARTASRANGTANDVECWSR